MSFQYPARVKQTTTTTGTGPLTLLAPAGQQRSFQTHYGSGPVGLVYCIAGQGYFEWGYGTFTAPNTLTRDFVIVSSNSNTHVSLPSATSDVFADWPGDSWGVDTHAGNYSLSLADRGNVQEFTAGATLSLMALSVVPQGFAIMVDANFTGGGSVLIDAAGSDTIMGSGTLTVPAGGAGILNRNGTEWRFFFYTNMAPPSGAPVILDSGNVQTGGATILTLDLSGYSAYKRLEIDIEGLLASSAGGTNIGIQFATNGGGFTWITTGYAGLSNGGTGTSFGNQIGLPNEMGFSSSPLAGDIKLDLYGINQSREARVIASGSVGSNLPAPTTGRLATTTGINAIKVYCWNGSSQNVTAGTYRVIGYT